LPKLIKANQKVVQMNLIYVVILRLGFPYSSHFYSCVALWLYVECFSLTTFASLWFSQGLCNSCTN